MQLTVRYGIPSYHITSLQPTLIIHAVHYSTMYEVSWQRFGVTRSNTNPNYGISKDTANGHALCRPWCVSM